MFQGTVIEWLTIYQMELEGEPVEALEPPTCYVFYFNDCSGVVLRKVIMHTREPLSGPHGLESEQSAMDGEDGILGDGGCQYECGGM